MQFEPQKLIDPSYLLDPNPPYQFAGFWPLFLLFGVALLVAMLLPLYPWRPWQEGFKQKLTVPLWLFSLGGLLLTFARNQTIPYLSSRLLLILFILASLSWIGYSFTVARKSVVSARIAHEQSAKREKYLPKKKQ